VLHGNIALFLNIKDSPKIYMAPRKHPGIMHRLNRLFKARLRFSHLSSKSSDSGQDKNRMSRRFTTMIALSAYIAFGDPGGASRAAFLSDPPSDSALGLLNPDLTGARAHTASPPVRLTVASIGVNTTLQALNLQADGALPVPTNSAQAGWYAAGVRPGSIGPAIVVGHVDSVNGPAVFFRLKQLRVGDEIRVLRMDGTTAVFQVDSVQAYPKNTFPQSTVYGPTTDPVLRLITCTGTFDQASQNYLGNLVVSSHLVREGRL